MAFSDSPALDRFSYFDTNNSVFTLLVYPLFFGVVIGLMTPFVNYFGSWCAKWPTEKLRLLQTESASKVLNRKAELAAGREIAAAEFKEAALKNAKANQAIDEADLNPAARQALVKNIETELRTSGEIQTEQKEQLNELQSCVLTVLAKKGGKNLPESKVWEYVPRESQKIQQFYSDFTQVRLQVDVKEALEHLKQLNLIEADYNYSGEDGVRLSAKGFRLFDKMQKLSDDVE